MKDPEGPVHVIGAASHEGGAALRHLRASGCEVIALFAEGNARRGRHARWSGPGIVATWFDQPGALSRTFSGAAAVVLVLDEPDTGPAERLRHGRAVIDAAIDAGVGHIVFAAAGPDRHRLSCDVSAEMACYLGTVEAPATILRPATFMEEVPWHWLHRHSRDLVLTTPFVLEADLPLVAVDDVGALAALAVTQPDAFLGRTLDVAGDILSPLDMASRLGAALDEPVRYEKTRVDGASLHQQTSTQVDGADWLRSVYPGLHTFADWLVDGGLAFCRRQIGPAPARGGRHAA